MARPSEIPATELFPQRPTAPQRENIIIDKGFQNKDTALADYPKLQVSTPTKLISQKIEQGSASSSVQTKESYTMKAPETFAQAVKPLTRKKPDTSPAKEEFEFLTKQALPIMAIDKQYERAHIASLIKPDAPGSSNIVQTWPRQLFTDGSMNGEAILEEIGQSFPNNFSTDLKIFKSRKKSLHYQNTLKCTESDRIKYLSKEFKIRGWTPKLVSKPPVKVSPRATSTSPSKNALKKRLKKALKEMDDDQSNEEDIMLLLEEVTSENDNGDMLDPTGIAAAYLESY
ncbi:hypothetical protein KY285_023570 [Solanum tuberosum]|nr:hypothetical protein KY289_023898 [Solanum tuberosum]KAH0675769.1 hypothetical protein KY285_023570 [Solanum tuberosum]